MKKHKKYTKKKYTDKKTRLNLKRIRAFTIVEVLIVLAIAGLVMLVVFLAVPKLMRDYRNHQRRNLAERVYAGMLDYKGTHAKIPGCDTASSINCSLTPDQVKAFFTEELPDNVSDPFTGAPYDLNTLAVDPADSPGSVRTASKSIIYVYDATDVTHSTKPITDQILIEVGHWCYTTKPDTGPPTNPIASYSLSSADYQVDKFVILIGTEKNSFSCFDNY
ncbi:type II secretion system GspH family protein [Candidatus Saccharibacteria bacterium]|nr:type II secretion system GspH family protein [Candidatus Saccharibacteria bacterium]